MGSWYWIGVAAGLGGADGLIGSNGFRRPILTAVSATVGGVLCGYLVKIVWAGGWSDLAAGGVGGLLAFLGAAQIVSGAFRRGGTRGGVAILVAGAALVAVGVAFIPVAGYLLPLALVAVAIRLRRRNPERYAGLRTLARD